MKLFRRHACQQHYKKDNDDDQEKCTFENKLQGCTK
jgi:hypothetical protein